MKSKSGQNKTLKGQKTSQDGAKSSVKEAKTPEQNSGQKRKETFDSSAVERSTKKKQTTIKSPAKDDKRDGSSSKNSSSKSKEKEQDDSSIDLEDELNENTETSMDDSNKNRQRKDRSTESSSEEEGNTAARNVRLAKTGVAFASPSASERSKGLLGGPLIASRDTSSTDHSDAGDVSLLGTILFQSG